MANLEEFLAFVNRDKERVERQFIRPPDVETYLQFFNEFVVTTNTTNIIERRGIGSSFVLTDTQYGQLGTGQSPQPFLGDSRPAFATVVTSNPGSPFVDNGRIQIRDFLMGSSNAVAPTKIAIGSGTNVWSPTQSGLQFQTGVFTIGSNVTEGQILGSFFSIIPSAQYQLGSVSEIAISGTNAMFMRDTFSVVGLGNVGSELRITVIYRIGSAPTNFEGGGFVGATGG